MISGLSSTVTVVPTWPRNFGLEKFVGGKDTLCDRGADREHGLVYDLAQAEVKRDATEEVSVDIAEAPMRDEEIDHAVGGGASGGDGVSGGFDDDPSFVERVLRKRRRGFDQRSGE